MNSRASIVSKPVPLINFQFYKYITKGLLYFAKYFASEIFRKVEYVK